MLAAAAWRLGTKKDRERPSTREVKNACIARQVSLPLPLASAGGAYAEHNPLSPLASSSLFPLFHSNCCPFSILCCLVQSASYMPKQVEHASPFPAGYGVTITRGRPRVHKGIFTFFPSLPAVLNNGRQLPFWLWLPHPPAPARRKFFHRTSPHPINIRLVTWLEKGPPKLRDEGGKRDVSFVSELTR